MHPILFRLPIADWPVRLFGLFVLDAFFLGTLWCQWRLVGLKVPAVREDRALSATMRNMVLGTVASRIVFLAIPGISWGVTLVGVLVVDFALFFYARHHLVKTFGEGGKKEADFLFNLTFWLLLVGFLGARIFWIFTTDRGPETFRRSPVEALFAIWDGGIVYYGGLICAAAFGAFYVWLKDRSVLTFGDILMPGVALTIYIGRWACFSAGCDFGKPTAMPWGLVYPPAEGTLIPGRFQGLTALHPTQLYLSLNGLVLFGILAFFLRRKRFDGQILWLFLMLYPLGRSFVEIFRGDVGRGIYEITSGLSLSSSQLISVPVLLFALFMFLRGLLRSRKSAAEPARAD